MTTQRAKFESFLALRGVGRQPEQEEALLAAADAYDSTVAEGKLSSERLSILVSSASNKHALVWQEAAYLLGALSETWPETHAAILALSTSPRAHVRFQALFCLKLALPADILDAILISGLTDKTARVRWKAAERIDRLEKRHLLPDLANAITAETNPEARRSMTVSLHLLRDGYLLEPWSEELQSLTVRTRDGETTRLVSTQTLASRGLEALVQEHRQDAERFPAG